MIQHKHKVWVTATAAKDAVSQTVGDRIVTRFSVWIGYGREDRKNKESAYLPTDFMDVKVWGSAAQHVKKGQDVEFCALKKKEAYISKKDGQKKVVDFYEVVTNEQGDTMLNFPGMEYGGTKGVSDEAIASGKAPSIQQRPWEKAIKETEITDDDIPFN